VVGKASRGNAGSAGHARLLMELPPNVKKRLPTPFHHSAVFLGNKITIYSSGRKRKDWRSLGEIEGVCKSELLLQIIL